MLKKKSDLPLVNSMSALFSNLQGKHILYLTKTVLASYNCVKDPIYILYF